METIDLTNPGNIALLSIFNVGADWEVFSKQLLEFFETSAIGEDRQVATFLTCISDAVYDILKNLCYPTRPITKTLPELINLLDGEFKLKVLAYPKHIEFDELRQNEEGIDEWYAKVKKAASECQFGQHLDFRVKDKFVTGMKPGPILHRLCEEQTSAILSEILEIALVTEATWINAGETIEEEILCHPDMDVKIEPEEIDEFDLADLHHSIDIEDDTLIPEYQLEEKPFLCNTCGRAFTRKHGLMVHERRTHNKDKKPFRCKFCDYACAVKLHLTKHLKTHTDKKPFACEFCDNKFAGIQALNTHVRTHTGEKPFNCHLCNKKFAHSSSLSHHINNHPLEKLPFNCSICDCKFAYRGSLEYHLRKHTSEMPAKK